MNCKATTKAGQPCRAPCNSSGFCPSHDESRRAARLAASRQGGLNRRKPPKYVLTEDLPFGTAREITASLGVVANAVLRGALEPKLANAAAFVIRTSVQAMATVELETLKTELAELEAIVRSTHARESTPPDRRFAGQPAAFEFAGPPDGRPAGEGDC